jgi:hypothetical protein
MLKHTIAQSKAEAPTLLVGVPEGCRVAGIGESLSWFVGENPLTSQSVALVVKGLAQAAGRRRRLRRPLVAQRVRDRRSSRRRERSVNHAANAAKERCDRPAIHPARHAGKTTQAPGSGYNAPHSYT